MSMKVCNAYFLKFVLKGLISGNEIDYRSIHNLTVPLMQLSLKKFIEKFAFYL